MDWRDIDINKDTNGLQNLDIQKDKDRSIISAEFAN